MAGDVLAVAGTPTALIAAPNAALQKKTGREDAMGVRSELKMLEQAIIHQWKIPAELYETLPVRCLDHIVNGTRREANAAMRVLLAMQQQNIAVQMPTKTQVNVGVQIANNTDTGRVSARAIVERIRSERVSE